MYMKGATFTSLGTRTGKKAGIQSSTLMEKDIAGSYNWSSDQTNFTYKGSAGRVLEDWQVLLAFLSAMNIVYSNGQSFLKLNYGFSLLNIRTQRLTIIGKECEQNENIPTIVCKEIGIKDSILLCFY